MPAAEIIAIGTELLLGEEAETNSRFIAQALRRLGIDLFRVQTVGDNSSRVARIIREALKRAEIIITTGGLGPTVDDPTRQAVADALNVKLEFHPELWQQIVARISRYGRTPTENQKKQAYIPRGAFVIENPVGTAPAFILTVPAKSHTHGITNNTVKAVISLPGVPREMETLMNAAVIPFLRKHFPTHAVIEIRTLHVSGLGEGMIDDRIRDLETLSNPTVGLTAHSGEVDIRIAAKASTPGVAKRMITRLENDLKKRLGENIFGADEESLEGIALDHLARQGWSLACLESNLGGALISRLSRTAHPAWSGGISIPGLKGSLHSATASAQRNFKAQAALGAALLPGVEGQGIKLLLITPLGAFEHHFDYGGHPANARRWAVNMVLDWLRRNLPEP